MFKIGQDGSVIKNGSSSVTGIPIVSKSIDKIMILNLDSNTKDIYTTGIIKQSSDGYIQSAKLIHNNETDSVIMVREIEFYAKSEVDGETLVILVNNESHTVQIRTDWNRYCIQLQTIIPFEIFSYKITFNSEIILLAKIRALVESI